MYVMSSIQSVLAIAITFLNDLKIESLIMLIFSRGEGIISLKRKQQFLAP